MTLLASPLMAAIQRRYELSMVTGVTLLTGGEWKTLWRLECAQGSYVVSLCHPSATVDSVGYEHAFLRYLQPRLPEVPAPMVAGDGSTFFMDEESGRIVVLFPLMPGRLAKRRHRFAAAQLLARFHQVAIAYPDQSPRPDVPAWHEWDWGESHWVTVQTMLTAQPTTITASIQRFWEAGEWAAQIVARREQILQQRAHCQQWMAALAHADRRLTWGPIHDDYHRRNLLTDGNRLCAMLDWDGCHPDWLALDLSVALWEFCLEKATHRLNLSHAQEFLAGYRAANGPVPSTEYDLIIPFIRCRRMIEVISVLQGVITGETWNADHAEYLVHNLLSLENLDGVTLG
jgi:Ser/Thr protein kinase RdoA (MazF antagonist)